MRTDGKRRTAALKSFLEDVSTHETPPEAEEIETLEGIADAPIISVADDGEAVLLANDGGVIEVARSRGVERWRVTTLLLKCAKDGNLTSSEATDVLYDLVSEGMNLHPKVYARVHKKLREPGS